MVNELLEGRMGATQRRSGASGCSYRIGPEYVLFLVTPRGGNWDSAILEIVVTEGKSKVV